jgi:hypothetical protein
MGFIKLFAAQLTREAIYNAVHGSSRSECETQVLMRNLGGIMDDRKGFKGYGKNRFVSLIVSDYSQRPRPTFVWLVEMIESLFDAKKIADDRSFEANAPFGRFPDFVFSHLDKKLGIAFLRDQYCWDLQNGCHGMIDMTREIEMFSNFLDEVYSEEQLAFYLICRDDCMKVGCGATVKTRELGSFYTESFVTVEQVEELVPKWWGKRFQKKFLADVLAHSVGAPAAHLESTRRYVAMGEILFECVNAYAEDLKFRVCDVLKANVIIPRVRSNDFVNLMKRLVRDLPEEEAIELYRTLGTRGVGREEISVHKFINRFRELSVLAHREMAPVISEREKELLETVRMEWNRTANDCNSLIGYFEKRSLGEAENLTLKMLVNDVVRHRAMLEHALEVADGTHACYSFYALFYGLDVIFSAVGGLMAAEEITTLNSMEMAIREGWLDSATGRR